MDCRQNIFGFCDSLDLAVAEDSEYVEFARSSKKSAQSWILSGRLHLERYLEMSEGGAMEKICNARGENYATCDGKLMGESDGDEKEKRMYSRRERDGHARWKIDVIYEGKIM